MAYERVDSDACMSRVEPSALRIGVHGIRMSAPIASDVVRDPNGRGGSIPDLSAGSLTVSQRGKKAVATWTNPTSS